MNTKTKGIVSYLVLAFGLAWILWEIPIRLGLEPESQLFQAAILPGAFSPAISAIIVRKWITGEGFTDAGFRLHFRKWPYYLVAWLLPLMVVGVIILLASLFDIASPDFTTERALKTLLPEGVEPPGSYPSTVLMLIPLQLLFTALLATPVLWGEEFGWRGYLQLRLFADRPVLAAVSTGIIWGIWHYPVNLRGYNFPEHPVAGLIVFPVSTVILSVIFGWLRLRSGSIWTASLAHASTNAVGGSLIMLYFAGGADMLFVGYTGLLAWIPLGLFALWIILAGRMKPHVPEDTGNGK
ncbi:MAG TPA: type II CAAX endopeptidase family protein [bacterium]|nr:type II CAAX endopeptidase family protein [bacterium]